MLQVTSPALDKIKEVIQEQEEKAAGLRVIAIPGPNGGVQYMMTMEQESQKDDTIVDMDGVHFLMDSDSIPFLDEATIDYVEDLMRTGFVINNPQFQAAGGCGCGNGGGSCGCGSGGCGSHE